MGTLNVESLMRVLNGYTYKNTPEGIRIEKNDVLLSRSALISNNGELSKVKIYPRIIPGLIVLILTGFLLGIVLLTIYLWIIMPPLEKELAAALKQSQSV